MQCTYVEHTHNCTTCTVHTYVRICCAHKIGWVHHTPPLKAFLLVLVSWLKVIVNTVALCRWKDSSTVPTTFSCLPAWYSRMEECMYVVRQAYKSLPPPHAWTHIYTYVYAHTHAPPVRTHICTHSYLLLEQTGQDQVDTVSQLLCNCWWRKNS